MNSEQITAFLQEYWYIASVLIGVVILIGNTHNSQRDALWASPTAKKGLSHVRQSLFYILH